MTFGGPVDLLPRFSAYIPIEYLDGGQLLYYILAGKIGEERADKICFRVSILVLVPLLATAGFYLLTAAAVIILPCWQSASILKASGSVQKHNIWLKNNSLRNGLPTERIIFNSF